MKMILVNMPFTPPGPAIGLSLLKAHAARLGVATSVAYPSLRFAELVGSDVYTFISSGADPVELPGDWVFAHCLHGGDPAEPTFALPSSPLREGVLSARELAEPFLQECLDRYAWATYDLVGFSSVFMQNVAALALAKRVKELAPAVPIIFGGANCEDRMGLQIHRSFPFVDYVCTGEADICFPEFLQSLDAGVTEPEIDGIVVRRGEESSYTTLTPERVASLDPLPYPDYDDYFEQPDTTRVVWMETSRGCWWGAKHHCTFCGLNPETMPFRRKESTRALDELLYLLERHGPDTVLMTDNILDMQYFRGLLPEIKRRGLEVDVFYEVKANLGREQLRLLSEAGVRTIQPGIESFNTRILHLMHKGTTALQNVQLLKWCREFAIRPAWNLLYGFPDEDPAAYVEMAAFIGSLHHFQPPLACGPVRLERFSPLFNDSERFRLRNVRPSPAYEVVYGRSAAEIRDLAYFFEFDFDDGRDPRRYARGLHDAVDRWRDSFGGFGLVYADDGAALGIFDYRGAERSRRRLLTGPAREVFLYCEENRPTDKILRRGNDFGWSDAETLEFLDEAVADGLMATADERYLGLAVRKSLEDSASGLAGASLENRRSGKENRAPTALATER